MFKIYLYSLSPSEKPNQKNLLRDKYTRNIPFDKSMLILLSVDEMLIPFGLALFAFMAYQIL